MSPIWFLRMKRWAKNPPSAARIKFAFAIIGVCALLYGYELLYGWPEWLTVNRLGRPRFN